MDQQEAGSEGVLKENMEERAERLALYIIENRTTVRAAAQKFGISKSTRTFPSGCPCSTARCTFG